MADPVSLVIGTTVGKTILGFGAAKAQEQEIRNQEVQNRIAANQQAIERTEKLRKILGAQNAQAAASSISMGSGSLQAIQRASFNEFAEDQELATLELDLENENLETKRRQTHGVAAINAFDNLFDFASFAKEEDIFKKAKKPTTFNIFSRD